MSAGVPSAQTRRSDARCRLTAAQAPLDAGDPSAGAAAVHEDVDALADPAADEPDRDSGQAP